MGATVNIDGVAYDNDSTPLPADVLSAARARCEAALPQCGRYNVIYADPPWRYAASKLSGCVEYPTMAASELRDLPVSEMAADDCALFMWITSPHMQQGLDLIRAWGFEMKTMFKVWSKVFPNGNPVSGIGWWSRGSCEVMLVASRGSTLQWKTTFSEPQLYTSVRSRHSEKPRELRDSIRDFLAVPGRRIELFARDIAAGWDAWGLEIPGYLHLSDTHVVSDVEMDTDTNTRSISTQTHGSLGEDLVGVKLTLPPSPRPVSQQRARPPARRPGGHRGDSYIPPLRAPPEPTDIPPAWVLDVPHPVSRPSRPHVQRSEAHRVSLGLPLAPPATCPPQSAVALPVYNPPVRIAAKHMPLGEPSLQAAVPLAQSHFPMPPAAKRKTVHLDTCRCIICKQQKRANTG